MNWISVKDRMPELDERVLVVDPKGYCWVAICKVLLGERYFEFAIAPERNQEPCCCSTDHPNLMNVTHWMPLPELPKEIHAEI